MQVCYYDIPENQRDVDLGSSQRFALFQNLICIPKSFLYRYDYENINDKGIDKKYDT